MRARPVLALSTAGALTLLTAAPALASSPADSGTITASPTPGGVVTAEWTGNLPGGANEGGDCTTGASDLANDHHLVTIQTPGGLDPASVTATFTLELTAPASSDVILSVKLPDGSVKSTDSGSVGAGETVSQTGPSNGQYDAIACTFAGGPQPYRGSVTLKTAGPGDTATPGGTSPGVTAPTYTTYVAPGDLGDGAGEPSIGTNFETGATLYQSGLETLKVTYDEAGVATWEDVSPPTTSITSLDPILHSDAPEGRTFVSQLAGATSFTAFSSDDFDTATPSEQLNSAVDHQSVGAGPYPNPLPLGVVGSADPNYPNAVYYCSQALAAAFCQRSDTGGLTFNEPRDLYTTECGGLHGHAEVSPDGTVYVPNKNCGGKQGFAVSTDAGQNWTVRTAPVSTNGISDPSVGTGADNTAYLGFADGDGHPKITVTRDRGETFSTPVDVGASMGIQNAVFPEVIAGDGDRASFSFLGTTTGGNSQDPDFGKNEAATDYTGGEWHHYVSTSYDRGLTWTTVDTTPTDPVQRGKICLGGTVGCGPDDRNLLDFNDIEVEKAGTVLAAYADGCTAQCVTSTRVSDNTFSEKASYSRQATGLTLFAAGAAGEAPSPVIPEVPLAALLPLTALAVAGSAYAIRRRTVTA